VDDHRVGTAVWDIAELYEKKGDMVGARNESKIVKLKV